MFRKTLIEILENNPMGISEIAEATGVGFKEIEEDLHHLQKSLRHQSYQMEITPAECQDCSFKFGKDKLHRPGRCPVCKQKHVTEPLIEIVKKD
ncbi:MAG: transcriptional regulator [Gammaproteobacteria bacterium]|nr:transcriptional regulator [Gammaproteobacteria bacterium]